MATHPLTSDAGTCIYLAARVHSFGPPDVIGLEEVAIGPPVEGEILVQANAAGSDRGTNWCGKERFMTHASRLAGS